MTLELPNGDAEAHLLEAAHAISEAQQAVADQESVHLEAAAHELLAIARKTKSEGWD